MCLFGPTQQYKYFKSIVNILKPGDTTNTFGILLVLNNLEDLWTWAHVPQSNDAQEWPSGPAMSSQATTPKGVPAWGPFAIYLLTCWLFLLTPGPPHSVTFPAWPLEHCLSLWLLVGWPLQIRDRLKQGLNHWWIGPRLAFCLKAQSRRRLMVYFKGGRDTSKSCERTAATCPCNIYCTFQENYMIFKYNKLKFPEIDINTVEEC